jgi:hypothetical protein
MLTTSINKEVQLVKSEFEPFEVSSYLRKVIAESVNLHKIERLKLLIGNEDTDTDWLDNNINYLSYEEKQLRAIIEKAKREGKKVSINAKIEITVD